MYRGFLIAILVPIFFCGNMMAKSTTSTTEDGIDKPVRSIEEAIVLHTSIDKMKRERDEKLSLDDLLKMYDAINRFEIDSLSSYYEFDIGREYFYLDSFSRALLYITKSISSCNPMDPDYDLLAQAHNIEGALYMEMGNFSGAINGFASSMEAYRLYEPSRVTYPIGNLSSVYYLIGDMDSAIKYTKQAIEYSKKLEGNEFYYNYGYDCLRLSTWYDELNELDSATYYIQKALSLTANLDSVEVPYKDLIWNVNQQMYKYHLKRNNITIAKEYLNKLFDGSLDTTGLKANMLNAHFDLAVGNKERLFDFLSRPVLDNVSFEEKLNALKFKIDVYKKYKHYGKALVTYEALQELKKSDDKINQEQYADFAYAQFETFEKEKEIQRLTKLSEIERLKTQKQKAVYLAVYALLFGLFSGMFFYFYFRYRRKDRFNKQLEEQVEKKTAALSKLNNDLLEKNEELNRFNFIVSHDLKEPIRSIVSFSHLIYNRTRGNNEVKEFAQYVMKSGKQLHSLIEDVSAFQDSDKLVLEKEQVSLDEIISEIKSINTRLFGEKNVVVTQGKLPVVFSSKVGLFIILKNLIENGIKYNNTVQPTIHISVEERENKYSIFVKDNGIGIETTYYEEIFTMFKRLHNREDYQGSGLGLAICRKVALKLNGKIEVIESTIGSGTTFKLTVYKDEIISASTAILENTVADY